jgi:hypothetical protein
MEKAFLNFGKKVFFHFNFYISYSILTKEEEAFKKLSKLKI